MSKKKFICAAAALLALAGSFTACNVYTVEEVELIQPPQINTDPIIIPDWDDKQTQ